jgi:hypothetical protein
MNRKKVTRLYFRPVSQREIVKEIDKITSKPNHSNCGISYQVLKKKKNTGDEPEYNTGTLLPRPSKAWNIQTSKYGKTHRQPHHTIHNGSILK